MQTAVAGCCARFSAAIVALIVPLAAIASIPGPEINTWDEAKKYETDLAGNPENLQTRSLLLAWYTRQYQDAKSNPARLMHILWAIEHQPGMRLADSRSLRVDERDGESFPRVRAAWFDQVQKQSSNPIVLLRAAAGLMRSDREQAAKWLKKVIETGEAKTSEPVTFPPKVEMQTDWWNWPFVTSEAKRTLAQLYTDAIVGVTARTPWEGTGPVNPEVTRSEFARSARQEIEQSKDGLFLTESAWWLHLTIQSLQTDGREDTSYVPLAWAWLQKAESFEGSAGALYIYLPSFQRYWSARSPKIVPPPIPRVVRSGSEAPQPIETVAAECPAEARYPPQGTVVNVKLVIANDGRVRFALLQGGSPAAIEPALAAARRWRFPAHAEVAKPEEVETSVGIPVCVRPGEQNRSAR
jgi:hypothetical protein